MLEPLVEPLEVRTAAWKIEATARMIARSVVLRKRQIDLSLVPLRDPLAPDPQTGAGWWRRTG